MLSNVLILAQQMEMDDGAAQAAGATIAVGLLGTYLLCIAFIFILSLIPVVLTIAGMWKVFEKANHPGWAAIVPFYNHFILNEIAGKDILWFILMLVPCANFVALLVISIDVAKCFGKDPAYGIGLALLPFVFYPMLGFSDAQYVRMKN